MAFIANLVARLGMDTSGFESGAIRVKKSLRDVTSEIAKSQETMVGLAKGAAAIAAIGVAYSKVAGTIKECVAVSLEMEKSQAALNSALRFSGEASREERAYLSKMADATADATGITRMAIREAAAYGLQIGITKEQITAATQAAIGFSEITGRDVASSLIAVKALLSGHADRLKVLGIKVDETKTAEMAIAEAFDKASDALRAHQELLKTTPGQYKLLEKAIGESKAELGKPLSKAGIIAEQFMLTWWSTLPRAIGYAGDAYSDFYHLFDKRNFSQNMELATASTDKLVASAVKLRQVSAWISPPKNVEDLAKTDMGYSVVRPGAAKYGPRVMPAKTPGRFEDLAAIGRAADVANRAAEEKKKAEEAAAKLEHERLEENQREVEAEAEAAKTAADQLEKMHTTMSDEALLAADTSGSFAELKERAVVSELAMAASNGDLDTQKRYMDRMIADQKEIARVKVDIKKTETATAATAKLDEQHDALQQQIEDTQALTGNWKHSAQYAREEVQALVAANGNLEQQKFLLDRIGEDRTLLEQADRLKTAYDDMKSTWESNMNAMLWSGQSFGDSMKNIFKSILAEIINMMVVEKAARGFAGMATNVIGALVGGAAGSGINPNTGGVNYGSYNVPTHHLGGTVWDSAPRLHRGLAADEFPAILQRGEAVTPKSGIQATVNIVNQSSQPVTGRVQNTAFDGKTYVTAIVLADLASNGRIAQTLGR
jgi:hypothetical protein